ncbi:MAG TPA: hypothetical protein VFN35_10370 [Ktedonobacteraceae bacterium]|nr:hypothetical protein [Ktedonobacteraceae bacterium]
MPEPGQGAPPGNASKPSLAAQRMAAGEQEGAETRAEMTGLLAEREAANEELQSTNEELETSREELQVINEQLSPSAQELQTRNEQLKAAQDYAEAIVETVCEPLVVLSEDLRIQGANLAFYQFFQMVPQI